MNPEHARVSIGFSKYNGAIDVANCCNVSNEIKLIAPICLVLFCSQFNQRKSFYFTVNEMAPTKKMSNKKESKKKNNNKRKKINAKSLVNLNKSYDKFNEKEKDEYVKISMYLEALKYSWRYHHHLDIYKRAILRDVDRNTVVITPSPATLVNATKSIDQFNSKERRLKKEFSFFVEAQKYKKLHDDKKWIWGNRTRKRKQTREKKKREKLQEEKEARKKEMEKKRAQRRANRVADAVAATTSTTADDGGGSS